MKARETHLVAVMASVVRMLIVMEGSVTEETHLLTNNDIQNIQTLIRPADQIGKIAD